MQKKEKSTNTIYSLFFGVVIFLISLTSFYFVNLPLVTLIGFIFLLFMVLFVNKTEISLNYDFYIFCFFFFIFIWTLFGVFLSPGVTFDFARVTAYLMIFFTLYALCVQKRYVDIGLALSVVLFIHILFFYTQFLGYYFFGQYIDYLEPLGLEARNFGGSYDFNFSDRMLRASGLFNEPGTYATIVGPLTAIYYRYVAEGKSKVLFFLSLISLFLTISTFGAIFFITILFSIRFNKAVKVVFLSIFSIFSLPFLYWRFFLRKEEGIETGTEFRAEFINAAVDKMDTITGFLWGQGGFSSTSFEFSSGGADNDSGLMFYILYYFGAFTWLLFAAFFIFLFLRVDRPGKVALVILSLSKVNFFAIIFPVYIYLIQCYRGRR